MSHMPTRIDPMLADFSTAPFNRSGWMYELKFDGIRCLAFKNGDGSQRLQGRGSSLPDITKRFPEIKVETRVEGVVLDGELVVMRNGRPDFNGIQQRKGDGKVAIHYSSQKYPAEYWVFDVLYSGGRDVMRHPLDTRKQVLSEVLIENEHVKLMPYLQGAGEVLFSTAVDLGFEGIMAKDPLGCYVPGIRSRSWRKIKPVKTETFWACGFTTGSGNRNTSFGSIILGEAGDETLRYVGCVGSGFSDRDIKEWVGKTVRQDFCPFYPTEPRIGEPVLYWFKPQPISVSYFERTNDQMLRFPRLAKK